MIGFKWITRVTNKNVFSPTALAVTLLSFGTVLITLSIYNYVPFGWGNKADICLFLVGILLVILSALEIIYLIRNNFNIEHITRVYQSAIDQRDAHIKSLNNLLNQERLANKELSKGATNFSLNLMNANAAKVGYSHEADL